MGGTAADLELDEGGTAEFGPGLEGGLFRCRLEGGLRGALAPAEEAEDPLTGFVPAVGQLDFVAADTADRDPAVIAGPFFRGKGAHRKGVGAR